METLNVFSIENSFAIIAIISTLIAIIVAISVAYNFYAIYDYNKKIEKINYDFNFKVNKLECDFNNKTIELDGELKKFSEINKAYALLSYEVNNTNARFKFSDKLMFEAMYEELKNILHILRHHDSFDDTGRILHAKCYYMANDLLKYASDALVVANNDYSKTRLTYVRDEIIVTYNEIIKKTPDDSKKYYNDIKDKLEVIFYCSRILIDGILNSNMNPIPFEYKIKLDGIAR